VRANFEVRVNRSDWIGWAFDQELPAGEKLLLVLLASRADARGVGGIELAELGPALGYEPRSLQRLRKSLRDAQLLREETLEGSLWFALGRSETDKAQLFAPEQLQRAGPAGDDRRGQLLTDQELDDAGEKIAGHVDEAADRMIARMNDQAMRLLGGMERLVLTLDQPAPEQPDPVRESRPYQAAIGRGVDEETAYALARELLEQFPEEPPAAGSDARSIRSPEPRRAAAATPAQLEVAGGGAHNDLVRYTDDTYGRMLRVGHILAGPDWVPHTDDAKAWEALEESENSNRTTGTVEGETPAFELLYPAIVGAARRVAGSMTLQEFINPKAVAEGRAPWDQVTVDVATDAAMNAELATMLEAIQRANHPKVQVPERVVEQDEGGKGRRTENLKTFYLRVKRVHQQLQHLQQMGV